LISLQPRYRRLLTVGALLDESIQLFREHWITLALFSLVALVPSWLLLMVTSVGVIPYAFRRPTVDLPNAEEWVGLFGVTIVQTICGLLWSAASTAAAATYLGGREPTVRQVYGLALKRLPTLLLTTLLLIALFVVLFVAATVLFAITLFGTLGSLIALVGLIYWWLKPLGRRPWLKWLIVLTAPYGLITYYFVRWAVFIPAVVLERESALDGLKRSYRLVEHEWFRAGAVLVLAGFIVMVLTVVPLLVFSTVVALLGLRGGLGSVDPTAAILTNTVTVVLQVVFSSVGTISYLMLFVDLRNRREGSDLGERISSLESAATSFRGAAEESRLSP
jgi:hypothetical protein